MARAVRFLGLETWILAFGALSCGRMETAGSMAPSSNVAPPSGANSPAPADPVSSGRAPASANPPLTASVGPPGSEVLGPAESGISHQEALAASSAAPSSSAAESSLPGTLAVEPDAGGTRVATALASDGGALDGPSAPGDMLFVPAGSFTMGADSGGQDDEHPAHQVTLGGFWLDRTEVTNAKWDECVSARACRPKSDAVRTSHPDFNGPNQPVSGVSWDDARAYCGWRGKRLPREAEFERAARDADDRRFAWGNEPPTHDRTVFASARSEVVGTHPAGRGPYGHEDLAGNVWEWMEDEYDPYAYRRPRASEGEPGTCTEILAALGELRREHKQGFTGSNPIPEECEHAIRGGAYNYDAEGLRATNRVHHPGRYRIPMLGLRCAKDASSP